MLLQFILQCFYNSFYNAFTIDFYNGQCTIFNDIYNTIMILPIEIYMIYTVHKAMNFENHIIFLIKLEKMNSLCCCLLELIQIQYKWLHLK